MVYDALSALVPLVTVNQFSINIAVVGEGGTVKLFASPARNSQSATARLLLIALYRIGSMSTLKQAMLALMQNLISMGVFLVFWRVYF